MSKTPDVKGPDIGNYIYVQKRKGMPMIRIFCYTRYRPGGRGLAIGDFESDRSDALKLRFAAAGYEVFPRYGHKNRLPKS